MAKVLPFSTPRSQPRTRADYVERIRAAQARTVEAILELGRELIAAKEGLEHGDWLHALKEVPMNASCARQFMAVVKHPILSNQCTSTDLPPSARSLYELTQVPDDVLRTWLADGTITATTTVRDVRARQKALPAVPSEPEQPAPAPDPVTPPEPVEPPAPQPEPTVMIETKSKPAPRPVQVELTPTKPGRKRRSVADRGVGPPQDELLAAKLRIAELEAAAAPVSPELRDRAEAAIRKGMSVISTSAKLPPERVPQLAEAVARFALAIEGLKHPVQGVLGYAACIMAGLPALYVNRVSSGLEKEEGRIQTLLDIGLRTPVKRKRAPKPKTRH